eukprot:800368-Pelagomonas_calceolata.AAC.4
MSNPHVLKTRGSACRATLAKKHVPMTCAIGGTMHVSNSRAMRQVSLARACGRVERVCCINAGSLLAATQNVTPVELAWAEHAFVLICTACIWVVPTAGTPPEPGQGKRDLNSALDSKLCKQVLRWCCGVKCGAGRDGMKEVMLDSMIKDPYKNRYHSSAAPPIRGLSTNFPPCALICCKADRVPAGRGELEQNMK